MIDAVPVTKRHINPQEQMFLKMDRRGRRDYVRAFYKEQNRFPSTMQPQPVPEWVQGKIIGTWRSREYLATAWPSEHPDVLCRLTVNRAEIDEQTGSWIAGISWDHLWLIKNQCGFQDYDAVEVFPSRSRLVNDSNMRHLWVLNQPMPWGLHAG